MQVLLRESVAYFRYQKPPVKKEALLNYLSRFEIFDRSEETVDLIAQKLSQYIQVQNDEETIPISNKPARKAEEGTEPEQLYRLSLHYSKQNNKLLFQIFKIILRVPNGLTYQRIRQQLSANVNIIAISHYCRKLYTAGFVSAVQGKDGVWIKASIYAPQGKRCSSKPSILGSSGGELETDGKTGGWVQGHPVQQPQDDERGPGVALGLADTFFFKELSFEKNVALNLQGAEALQKGGLTKEDICLRLMKESEKKSITRYIDSKTFGFNPSDKPIKSRLNDTEETAIAQKPFHRISERKGRIYEFKYQGDLTVIKAELARQPKAMGIRLRPHIEAFLLTLYPQYAGTSANIVKSLVDDHVKEYKTSLGQRTCMRQCTQLKLDRYVYVLNCVDDAIDNIYSLKRYINERERDLGTGQMHKRTLQSIVQGLVGLGAIRIVNDYVVPNWKQFSTIPERKSERLAQKLDPQIAPQPKKKVKTMTVSTPAIMMSETKYLRKALLESIVGALQQKEMDGVRCAFKQMKRYRKEMQKERGKSSILYILEEDTECFELPKLQPMQKDFESICAQVDQLINSVVRREEYSLDGDLKRYLRAYPQKKVSELYKRFGKDHVKEAIKELQDLGYMVITGQELDTSSFRMSLPKGVYLL